MSGDGKEKTLYEYNESNMLKKVNNMTLTDAKLGQFGTYSSYSYEYYADGNIKKKTKSNLTATYTYSLARMLTRKQTV